MGGVWLSRFVAGVTDFDSLDVYDYSYGSETHR